MDYVGDYLEIRFSTCFHCLLPLQRHVAILHTKLESYYQVVEDLLSPRMVCQLAYLGKRMIHPGILQHGEEAEEAELVGDLDLYSNHLGFYSFENLLS